MERLDQIFFYSLDKAIKSYRQFAQRTMLKQGFDLTIDQWLVLKCIIDNPDWTQNEVAEASFKDFASVTRIIDLLVKKGYLVRELHSTDRRRFKLDPTPKAMENLKAMEPVTGNNRETALKGITKEETELMQKLLDRIIKNCNS
ncbi:MAG TPA: MarR family transcriptional regulator [Mucilaginibacter sp.]|jgi:DNA-binding MarR family transcriptional regulator|nr:MarR family transcriptional regulator [Mucilaginibacter sp.]